MSDDTLPQNAALDDQETIDHGACIAEAWRLLSEGVYTFRAIARGVREKTGCTHDDKWVKRALVKHGQLVSETIESGAIDSRAKYLQAIYARRAAAARIVNKDNTLDSARVAALKVMVDCDEKIAAAEGVVTQRRAEEVRGEHSVALVTPEQIALMANREKE